MNLGMTFDQSASRYHRARPRYPQSMLDALVRLAHLDASSRVLEIGAGTGIATLPLAEVGMEIVSLEPGPALAAAARANLAGFPNVTVVESTFEAYEAPAESFDAIVSATAFHWVTPAMRYTKTAELLKPRGILAMLDYGHVAGGDQAFFESVQRDCYHRYMPDTAAVEEFRNWDDPPHTAVIEANGRFAVEHVKQELEVIPYTTAEYLDVLNTYSGHIALDGDARNRLLDCIAGTIDRDYGGKIGKAYGHQLVLARRIG